jgi:hypothetical protein
MDQYFKLELDSWGLSFSGAQVYGGISYLGIGIVIAGVVAYKVIKRYQGRR